MREADAGGWVEDLFRRESAHLVAALVRLLGPSHLTLAEDMVQEALLSAMQAFRFGRPEDPKAWILRVASNRALDALRKQRRRQALQHRLEPEWTLEGAVELALSPAADAENQLAMMFAICDGALASETHVTLILRLLCGFSSSEIARAFLVDVGTIDRRLHRGGARLQALGELTAPAAAELRTRQESVEQALYLLFNEGYHGSDPDSPLQPAMCADALRLGALLLRASEVEQRRVHALLALFCFNAARLATRLDEAGVVVPLEQQDRTRWDRSLLEAGIEHLGASAGGAALTTLHLEAGIAFEHTRAASVASTDWAQIVDYYDALLAREPSPIVALNRALALAELRGLEAGRAALAALSGDARLHEYSFFWAGRADVERRAGRAAEARAFYRRASELAKSRAERAGYERRLNELEPAHASAAEALSRRKT